MGIAWGYFPRNYPWSLALLPVIDAFAAGNVVMLKPSELTPHTSTLLARLACQYFTQDELVVIQGDASTAQAFSKLPFDHLVFTGSTSIGRHVASAAAANLTPVTLELGGKSPALAGR